MADDDDTARYLRHAQRAVLGLKNVLTLRHFTRPPGGHQIYQLVGQVASEWAHLEHLLDLMIWALAGIADPEGACITAQLMGARPRYLTLIAQLTLRSYKDERFTPYIKRVDKLMTKTFNPQDRRNRIVHDPWYVTSDFVGSLAGPINEKAAQFKSMPHKELKFGIHDVDLQEISETLAAIKELAETTGVLRAELIVLLASQEKRP